MGVAGSAPFFEKSADGFSGVSVEIWEELAEKLNINYEYQEFASVSALLKALERGRVDLAIGPISVTSTRAQRVDFTQPYYKSGMGILIRRERASIWETVSPFLRRTFLVGVLTLLIVLFIIGNIIWLAERKSNESFPERYIPGVGTGMWFAVVTFTTVGYGDLAPITRTGRLVASVWMIVALVTASSLTASIATSFTLIKMSHVTIDSPTDLKHKRVATVRGSTGVEFALRYGAKPVLVKTKQDAVERLIANQVDAFAYDYPIMRYLLNENPHPELAIIRSHNDVEYYGFAVRLNNPLVRRLNTVLLQALEEGMVSSIRREWGLD